jgi:hypothetical protein
MGLLSSLRFPQLSSVIKAVQSNNLQLPPLLPGTAVTLWMCTRCAVRLGLNRVTGHRSAEDYRVFLSPSEYGIT